MSTNIDDDFNIENVLGDLPASLKPYMPDGKHIYNDAGVVLICDKSHDDFYMYGELNRKLKCHTCNCRRQEKAVLLVAEKLFKVTMIVPKPNMIISRQPTIRIFLQGGEGEENRESSMKVVAPTAIKIILAPPYQQKIIYGALKALLTAHKDELAVIPKLHKIALRCSHAAVKKEPPPKTYDMMLLRGVSPMQLKFDNNVLPVNEAKALCLENCYYV
jgi:hypothetical protein